MVGGTAGYNLQFGSAVFGLEGDFDWSDIKGSTTANCATNCETTNTWFGTARGRIGYAFDRFLPYFTAGAAFGDVKAYRRWDSAAPARRRSAGLRAAASNTPS